MAGIDANTVLMLHFDNNAIDSSSTNAMFTNNNVIFNNSISKFGGFSGEFAGNSHYLSESSASVLNIGTYWTFDTWIYPTSANAPQIFYCHGTVGLMRFNGGGLGSVEFVAAEYQFYTNTGIIPLNQWSHLAVVKNGSNWYCFVNGVSQTINDEGGSSSAVIGDYGSSLRIGTHFNGNYGFIGYLDELRVSNIARWTTNFTPPTSAYSAFTPIFPVYWDPNAASIADSKALVAQSEALSAAALASLADSKAVVEQSEAVSSGDLASIAQSEAEAFNTTNTANASIADSKAVAAQLADSVADSKAVISQSQAVSAGVSASVADSKAVVEIDNVSTADSKAVLAQLNDSIADSKALVAQDMASTADSDAVVAQSEAVSAGLAASVADSDAVVSQDQASIADSKALVAQASDSVADSKAVSAGIAASVADSKAVSDAATVSAINGALASTIGTDPNPGEYSIYDMKLDASESLVITYEDTPVPPVGDANTVLLMHFDGNVNDSSLLPNTVTNNGLTFTSGYFGSAGSFDGSSRYASVQNAIVFNPNANWTIEFFVNSSNIGAQQILYESKSSTGTTPDFVCELYAGNIEFYTVKNGGDYGYGFNIPSLSLSSNTWYHIAVVKNGTNWYCFVNGVAQTLNTIVGATTNTIEQFNSNSIHLIGMNIEMDGRGLQGMMDEFRISTTARWTANFTPPVAAYV